MRNGELTKAERLEIKLLLDKGYSRRAIGSVMVRSPNTISYELKLKQNSVRGSYDPKKADAKARVRKQGRRFQYRKIERVPEIKRLVIEKLQADWNPDEIAGWLGRHQPTCYVSKSAIYAWLRTSRGERYCDYLYSQRKRPKPHRPKTERTLIPDRVGIEKRPRGATNRTRYGHAERDTIVGKTGTPGGLAVLYERKTKLVRALKVTSLRPAEHLAADQPLTRDLRLHSITRDNGIENTLHGQLAIPSYFCDPYRSWQKGGVENVNKLLRRYFPKGTDFRQVTQQQVDGACDRINEKPRRSLGYRCIYKPPALAGEYV